MSNNAPINPMPAYVLLRVKDWRPAGDGAYRPKEDAGQFRQDFGIDEWHLRPADLDGSSHTVSSGERQPSGNVHYWEKGQPVERCDIRGEIFYDIWMTEAAAEKFARDFPDHHEGIYCRPFKIEDMLLDDTPVTLAAPKFTM
jgi:hypothetical protein